MAIQAQPKFSPTTFLTSVGEGRSAANYDIDQIVFAQGDPSNAVFFIQCGKVKIAFTSVHGKEAVSAVLGESKFLEKAAWADSWRERQARLL